MKITEEKYKELSEPLLKGKKNKKETFTNFLEYIDIKNIKDDITKNNYENFEKYFLEFADIEFNRLNFSPEVKLELLKRSGGCCAICGTLTIFPSEGNQEESLTIAAACHIHPASANGPRSNIQYRNKNMKEISKITNGLWACLACHYEIDKDAITYTVDILIKIKDNHENKIRSILRTKPDIKKIIDNFQKMNDSEYTQVKITDYKMYDDLKEDNLYLVRKLKEIERESIQNAPLFTTLKSFIDKKNEELGDGDFGMQMSKDEIKIYMDIKKTDQNIDEVKQKIGENLKKVFPFNYTKTTEIEFVRRSRLVQLIADKKKDLELFLVNKDENKIVKIKNLGFKIVSFEENSIKLVFLDSTGTCLVEIEVVKLPDNEYWFSLEDCGIFSSLLAFVPYLEDFDLLTSTLMIKHQDKDYPIDFSKVFEYNNGKYELISQK